MGDFLQIFSAKREQKMENSIHGEKSNQLCKYDCEDTLTKYIQ